MKNVVVASCFLLMFLGAAAQDSTRAQRLDSVVITGFEQNRGRMRTAAVVHTIQSNKADLNNKVSLVQAFNTGAGVRMEERSPGSYRINIRGSSLRSPFGVRNVKVYWNGIPLTDPGGNTYFNQLAFNNFSSIEIFKGPAGSLYGAGTGGLVLVSTLDNAWKPGVSLEHMRGSFGLNNVFATMKMGGDDNKTMVTYAHNGQDGYRLQSAMRRDNASWSSMFKISDKYELRANVLFTDMYYQTPGGLTKAEFDKDPKAARPAAGGLPSAVQAKAAIYQKNILAGVQQRVNINSHWSNNTVLYAAYAQIKNPAVRNYERRSEPHAGGRTTFTWEQKGTTSLKFVAGGELQHGFFNTQVFSNKLGNPDTLQTDDDIDYNTYSLFAQADVSFAGNWTITAGTSLNNTKVNFTRLNRSPVTEQERTYRHEWAPRIALVKAFSSSTSAFGIVSKGFSPPSIAELLPSTGVISTQLEAETGWNYEAGLRQRVNGALWMELSGYYFKLNNTLVQRRDASGADFFINAGDTRQKGIELTASYLVRHFSAQAAYSYSHYRYGSFTKDTIDFSGKIIPSVPSHTISAIAETHLNNGVYCNATYYFASKIFLNDANTAAAKGYHLLGLRAGWAWSIRRNMTLSFYAGADNLLDEVYSLGNDINDPRGRYYNTAARRNYYAGAVFKFDKK